MSGLQPIEALTEADGYVLGWAGRYDECSEREWFIGRIYDIHKYALINEWTGRWRAVTHWMPLPTTPRDSS